jgi:hypothetical protein
VTRALRKPLPLALPFGVVGVAAGIAVASLQRACSPGAFLGVVLTTSVLAMVVGRYGASRGPLDARWALLVFLGPFLPAFMVVTWAARRLGTARAGSLIDGAHRRGVWVAVAFATAGTLTASFAVTKVVDMTALFVVASGCALVLAIAFFVDVDAVVKLVRWRAPAGARVSPGAAPLVVDYGIGDEVEEREQAAATLYRESARAVVVFRGTRCRAVAALVRSTVASGLALSLVLGSSIAAFVLVR